MINCNQINVFLLVFIIVMMGDVFADCIADKNDQIFCSEEIVGGAALNKEGIAMCHGGKCIKNNNGDVICSIAIGGGVAKDSTGEVFCNFGCVKGSHENCVPGQEFQQD